MSYCRFSSDDYQCDVYCYHAEDGYVIHVAGNRRVFTPPPPVPDEPSDFSADVKRWSVVTALFAKTKPVDIGGPHDSACFTEATPAFAADRLESLRGDGYRVPQYAIDELRKESGE